ncbi:MAG TPA: hypothetical protein VLL05_16110, partial [Terriglobales bacterium]|nr:hypothetical protein [Terriglobales bacterium]
PWLSFSADGVLTGNVPVNLAETHNMVITAQDGAGYIVKNHFSITSIDPLNFIHIPNQSLSSGASVDLNVLPSLNIRKPSPRRITRRTASIT